MWIDKGRTTPYCSHLVIHIAVCESIGIGVAIRHVGASVGTGIGRRRGIQTTVALHSYQELLLHFDVLKDLLL